MQSKHGREDRGGITAPISDRASVYPPWLGFFTGLFAGPFAVVFLSALNAWYMGRLNRDLQFLGILLAVSFGLVGWGSHAAMQPPPPWSGGLAADDFRRVATWIFRSAGPVVWLAVWLRYRRNYASARVRNVPYGSPWLPAVACILAGIGLQILTLLAVRP